MSVSIVVLKKINEFSYLDILNSVKKAASKANMYCIYIDTYFNDNNEFEYLEGALSEVDEKKFQENYKNEIHTRTCGFSIQKPTKFSYDSFSWLIHDKNYFWAFDLEYLDGDYEFAFRFLSQYFRMEENKNDYLWFDYADWYYTAQDIVNLSKKPYNPEWMSLKSLNAAKTTHKDGRESSSKNHTRNSKNR